MSKTCKQCPGPQKCGWKLEGKRITNHDPEICLSLSNVKARFYPGVHAQQICACAAKMCSSVQQHVATAEEKHAITLKRLYVEQKSTSNVLTESTPKL